jgi:hypothetical protein
VLPATPNTLQAQFTLMSWSRRRAVPIQSYKDVGAGSAVLGADDVLTMSPGNVAEWPVRMVEGSRLVGFAVRHATATTGQIQLGATVRQSTTSAIIVETNDNGLVLPIRASWGKPGWGDPFLSDYDFYPFALPFDFTDLNVLRSAQPYLRIFCFNDPVDIHKVFAVRSGI